MPTFSGASPRLRGAEKGAQYNSKKLADKTRYLPHPKLAIRCKCADCLLDWSELWYYHFTYG
jgi:hypothetical protein